MIKTKRPRSRVFFHCNVQPSEISPETEKLITKQGIIRDAYFGKTAFCPYGLNIEIDFSNSGVRATYTDVKDRQELLYEFGTKRAKDLAGKNVIAHMRGMRFLGLSVYSE